MKIMISTELGEFTKAFKLNQEEYLKKHKDFMGEDFNLNNSLISPDNAASSKRNDFLMTTDENNILAKRDNEISNLLTSINDLSQVFKDMQNLVMEQGTILDRIDYNIEVASTNIESGKKNLQKAEKHMKQNCARKAILTVMTIDFILALLLVIKFIV